MCEIFLNLHSHTNSVRIRSVKKRVYLLLCQILVEFLNLSHIGIPFPLDVHGDLLTLVHGHLPIVLPTLQCEGREVNQIAFEVEALPDGDLSLVSPVFTDAYRRIIFFEQRLIDFAEQLRHLIS